MAAYLAVGAGIRFRIIEAVVEVVLNVQIISKGILHRVPLGRQGTGARRNVLLVFG